MPLYRKNRKVNPIFSQNGADSNNFKSPLLQNKIHKNPPIQNSEYIPNNKQKSDEIQKENQLHLSFSNTAYNSDLSNGRPEKLSTQSDGKLKKAPKKKAISAAKISSTKQNFSNSDDTDDLDRTIESLWSQTVVPTFGPPDNLTQYERLVWVRKQRDVGLYVQCDDCNKNRYLKDVKDPLELPDLWYCPMNPDKNFNRCSVPEVEISPYEEEDLIHNLYNAGSVVWAKLEGYPWWPAIVDDDPDIEQYYWVEEFSDVPTHYHVVFFDSQCVSRAWLKPTEIHKFLDFENDGMFKLKRDQLCYERRVSFAKIQASNALGYSLYERLERFGFLARWPFKINNPVDDKKLEKKRNKLPKTKKSKEAKKKLSLPIMSKKNASKKKTVDRVYSSSIYSNSSHDLLSAVNDALSDLDFDDLN